MEKVAFTKVQRLNSNVKVQGPIGSADFLTFYVRGPYDFEFLSGVDNVACCKDSKNKVS